MLHTQPTWFLTINFRFGEKQMIISNLVQQNTHNITSHVRRRFLKDFYALTFITFLYFTDYAAVKNIRHNNRVIVNTGWPKILTHFVVCIMTSLNIFYIDPFWNFFHCHNLEKICNNIKNTVTNDPTIPQMGRYTTLWNVNVLKQQFKTRLMWKHILRN